jgi:hypothetical protein
MNLNPVGWASSSMRLLARLISNGVNSTRPVLAISEAPFGSADVDIALVSEGIGATLAQVPDGAIAGGNKRGNSATDWQKVRISADQVASGTNSFIGGGARNRAAGENGVICGGIANVVTQQHSAVLGGSTNTVSGQIAAIAGGFSNTASSTYAFVGGGQNNIASNVSTFVGGGFNNTAQTIDGAAVCGGNNNNSSGYSSIIAGGSENIASGGRSSVLGGQNNTASGAYASVAGGFLNTANGASSFVSGGSAGSARGIAGYHVFPACDQPIASPQGIIQSGLLLLGRQTIDATATVLTSNTSAASTTNQVILPNNSAYAFKGTVIATVTGGGNTAAWEFKGAIKRGANAASTAIVGGVVKEVLAYDAGASAWDVTFTADTTNGGLRVQVTGAASTTIRWAAKIETAEVTY